MINILLYWLLLLLESIVIIITIIIIIHLNMNIYSYLDEFLSSINNVIIGHNPIYFFT